VHALALRRCIILLRQACLATGTPHPHVITTTCPNTAKAPCICTGTRSPRRGENRPSRASFRPAAPRALRAGASARACHRPARPYALVEAKRAHCYSLFGQKSPLLPFNKTIRQMSGPRHCLRNESEGHKTTRLLRRRGGGGGDSVIKDLKLLLRWRGRARFCDCY
jgi:hypothetical protein